MAPDRPRANGFVVAVVLRAVVLAVLIAALAYLLLDTRFYATALVVTLCAAATVADLFALSARAERASLRFVDALAAGALEAPVYGSAVPGPLRDRYDQLLLRLRQERREQLQQSEYLRTLLDTVPAGLIVLDADGALALVNRAAHRLLGEPAHSLAELPVLGPAAAVLAGLPPGTHQVVRLTNGNSLLASAAQFSVPGAGTRRLIALQRLTGDLDAVELKAWDDMGRVLAHEMMNSLTPIASLSESLDGLIRRGGPAEDVAAALETISRRSQGLMRFVDRYRKVAELPQPQLQAVNLGTLLEGVGRLTAPALGERGIAFEVRMTSPDLRVNADPDLLEQALINLLRNAGDAAAGTADARVSVTCGFTGELCCIDVADNGPGLTAAEREQIFVPFFTTKPGGSGVGLSLARSIAQRHGGHLIVRPNAPQGSIFQLSLPIQSGAFPSVPTASASVAAEVSAAL